MKRLPFLFSCLMIICATAARAEETAPAVAAATQPFRLTTLDSMELVGDYNPPAAATAPVLILLHGLGSARGEWAPLAAAASRRGWGALAYDARGHGESVGMLGQAVSYQDPRFGRNPQFWKKMIGDLVQVATTLQTRHGIAGARIVFVGASLGANVALNAAGQLVGIPAVVLMSPGLKYAGIETETVVQVWKRPMLLVAAAPDDYATQSAIALQQKALKKEKVQLLLLDQGTAQGAHGVQLFDGKLEVDVLDWIAGAMSTK